jgi:uncharacterized protein YceH (UPF0502 family)
MYHFRNLEETENTISELASLTPEPLVTILGRRPGQKERRCTHLLSGTPDEISDTETQMPFAESSHSASEARPDLAAQVAGLTEEMVNLKADMRKLREELEDFRSQLE